MDKGPVTQPTFHSADAAARAEICEVFLRSFAASEGAQEAQSVVHLVNALLDEAAEDDTLVYVAQIQGQVVGAILWSWLRYPNGRGVRLLSPVAVHPDVQGRGVGQGLIRYGVDQLRAAGVGMAVTYGDPQFYGKVGFTALNEEEVAGPYPLSMPFGWLGQRLTTGALDGLSGRPICVMTFAQPELW